MPISKVPLTSDCLAQLFNGSGSAASTIAAKSAGFVVPFFVEKIDCVFKCAGSTVIIFGSYKNKGVKSCNLCRPVFSKLLAVPPFPVDA